MSITGRRSKVLLVAGLLPLLAAVIMLALCAGSAWISPPQVIRLLTSKGTNPLTTVVLKLRLPRTLLGTAVGGALGLAGVMLQGLFRNPLVEPYTLGISGGAALGVALAIVFKLNMGGNFSLALAGFAGAMAVIGLLYLMAQRKGVIKIQALLLTGVMLSFISSSLIMLVMAVSRAEDLHGIVFWIMGFLGDANWAVVWWILGSAILVLVVSFPLSLQLNALALGEEEAMHMGIDVEQTKQRVFLMASFLTGICVAFCGVIGFVGLVVPHLMRLILGIDHRFLFPASFLFGAIFLVLCDTLARTIISPMELPVGVITGILGGVLFIHALTRRGTAL